MERARAILVVERDDAERGRLVAVLAKYYRVESVPSGSRALDRLATEDFDLVLLGGIGCGRENEAVLAGLSRRVPRPKVILIAPAFCREVLERAAILDADGVLESRDEREVEASVVAHLGC